MSPVPMPAGASARLKLRGRVDIPILLLDLGTIDGTMFYWSNVSGNFPCAADGSVQTYMPWIKSAGPFSHSRDFTTDGGDIVVQNLSGNTIERDVSKLLRDHEFEGTLAVLREYDEQLGVIEEFRGRLFEQTRDASEASFRMVQIFDANEYEVADTDYQEGCTLRYKSEMCGATSVLTTCPKTVAGCIARNNIERFTGCPNPPPANVVTSSTTQNGVTIFGKYTPLTSTTTSSSALVQIGASAQLGIPRPLLYGNVSGKGNLLLLHQPASKHRYALIGLGEGELDGLDKFWMQGKPLMDGTFVHFHQGQDSVIGATGMSVGTDQRIDAFFAQFPSQVQQLMYNRLAYLFVDIVPDPGAVSEDLDWLAHLRGLKVRTFDASGNQTGYVFSTNPTWWKVDLMLRAVVKPEAMLNANLSAYEKACFDWPSIYDGAQRNDALLAGGQKRFEGGVAFGSRIALASALSQMCVMDQSYMVERAGKIFIYADKPRASTFVLKSEHLIGDQPVRLEKTNLRGAPNRYSAKFYDVNPVKIAGITSMSRINGATIISLDGDHSRQKNDWIEVVNHPTVSFNGMWIVDGVPSSSSLEVSMSGADATAGPGGYLGTPESRFRLRTKEWVHEAHQNAVGQRGINLVPTYKRNTIELDLGVSSAERCGRIIAYQAQRDLGMKVVPYKAPFSGVITCRLDSVDDADNILRAQVPGDILTLDSSADEECGGDYEIQKMSKVLFSDAQSGSKSRTVELTVKQSVAAAYSDVSDDEPVIAGGRSGDYGPTIWWDPNSGQYVQGGNWGQNQLVNPRFDLPAANASSDLCADWYQETSGQIGQCSRVLDGYDSAYCLEVRVKAVTTWLYTVQTARIRNRTVVPAAAGQRWLCTVKVKVVMDGSGGGYSCSGYVEVRVLYSDGSTSSVNKFIDLSLIGTWQSVGIPLVVPTPAGKTIVGVYVDFGATAFASDGGTMPADLVVRFASPILVRAADASTDEINKTGSMPPTVGSGVSYTSTTTTITPAWNLDIYRSNSLTPFNINGSQLCTGLTIATSYSTWIFYAESKKAVGAVLTGGTGSPAWMHDAADLAANARARLAEQLQQDNIPLSATAVTMSTTASGTGGGTGGGDGGCLWGRMKVRERTRGVIYLSWVRVGDYLLGRDGKYRRVRLRRAAKHDLWAHTTFNCYEALLATVGHPYTLMDGTCCKAALLTFESEVPCETGVTFPVRNELITRTLTKVSITLDDDAEETMWSHTFLAGTKRPIVSSHNRPVPTV